ncbi:GNVR domain-containing protein [Thermodesulfovibrio hydrogeniphilus]
MKAEETMRGFQEKTGALQVEEQIKALIEGIAELRAKIAAKEVEIQAMKTYSTPNNPDLQKAVEALKTLKVELCKLEAKVYEKLDEAREAVVIQVIEEAVPPEKKVKPKRGLMVTIATFLGFFLSVFLAFFMEYKEKIVNDPQNRERVETLKKYLVFNRLKGK